MEKNNDEVLTELELAQRLKIAPGTLRNRRCAGMDIPHFRIGKAIRYHWPTVQAFLSCGIPVKSAVITEKPRRGRPRKMASPATSPNLQRGGGCSV